MGERHTKTSFFFWSLFNASFINIRSRDFKCKRNDTRARLDSRSQRWVFLTPMLRRRGDLMAGKGRVFMESMGDWYSQGLARSGELAHRPSFSCTHTHTHTHTNLFKAAVLEESGLWLFRGRYSTWMCRPILSVFPNRPGFILEGCGEYSKYASKTSTESKRFILNEWCAFFFSVWHHRGWFGPASVPWEEALWSWTWHRRFWWSALCPSLAPLPPPAPSCGHHWQILDNKLRRYIRLKRRTTTHLIGCYCRSRHTAPNQCTADVQYSSSYLQFKN